MPYFSETSLRRLRECDERLQKLFEEVVRYYDCVVVSAHRGEAEQNGLFKAGKSQLQYPQSKHNSKPSMAIDVAPFDDKTKNVPWNHKERFYYLGGIVKAIATQQKVPIRWGGDWDGDGDFSNQSFMDLSHYEISG